MTHDVCHCSDYNKTLCPEDCYRAKVTADLKAKWETEFKDIPMSFAHFKGTPYCPKWPEEEKK